MADTRIAVFIGSLRKASWTRKVALAMDAHAPAGLTMEIIEIGDLPAYNEDIEGEGKTPEQWTRFRDAVRPCDGLLFYTPEYNRGVPGFLKNAIDVGSRPYGKSVFSGKPGGIVSCSPGAIGGVLANHSLRQPMVFLDVPLLQQPEAYIGGVNKLFDDAGNLMSEDTKTFFTKYMAAYGSWVAKFRK